MPQAARAGQSLRTPIRTYRTSIETMRKHGQQQQCFGLQWVLHLKCLIGSLQDRACRS
jgi:hypothetical protein